jgi:hypothetical protein
LRASTSSTKTVGDFSQIFTSTPPTQLSFVNNAVYGFNSTSNQIGKMGLDGVATLTTDKTQGIGFFLDAVSHTADKSIVFITNTPGVAIFDTKTNTLAGQDIGFTTDKPALTSLGVFGSRLYVYDSTTHNIYSFNKTLRGYTGGAAWITDATFPKDTIKSFAIDGSIYTLHTDGTIRELYKGTAAKFTMENITPSLSGATKIITNEDLKNLYILDPANKRVVVMSKTGQLIQQVMIDAAQQLRDITISSDESTLYALDGSRVLSVSLATPTSPAPTN